MVKKLSRAIEEISKNEELMQGIMAAAAGEGDQEETDGQ